MPSRSRQRRGTGRRSGEDRLPGHRTRTPSGDCSSTSACCARRGGRRSERCAMRHSLVIPTTVSRSHDAAACSAHRLPNRGGSSVGQSSGLIIRRSQVQVLPAPRGKPQVTRHMWRRPRRRVSDLPRICPAPVTRTARGFANTHVTSLRSARAYLPQEESSAAREAWTGQVRLPGKRRRAVRFVRSFRSARYRVSLGPRLGG